MPPLCDLCNTHHRFDCDTATTFELLVTERVTTRVIVDAFSRIEAENKALAVVRTGRTEGYEDPLDGIISLRMIG